MNTESFENNFESPPEPIIQDASEEDIADILSIQAEKIIVPETEMTEKEKDIAGENGFLVYPAPADELKNLIEDKNKDSHLVRVAKEEGKTVGYIISYDMKEWTASHPDWFSRIDASDKDKAELENEKVFYGRHIAVDENAVAPGIGKELLDSTLQEATRRGYKHFVVEVLKEPITNNRSINFVKREGFRLVGESEDENKRVWFVFLKDLSE